MNYPSSAVNVTSMATNVASSLALNTAYCGPLSSNMNVKGKLITNAKEPYIYTAMDSEELIA